MDTFAYAYAYGQMDGKEIWDDEAETMQHATGQGHMLTGEFFNVNRKLPRSVLAVS